jgi:DNA (cytosine-5)-methyltransferase 1
MGLSRSGFHHELMAKRNEDAVESVLHSRRRGIKHVREWSMEKADVREVTWHHG